MTEPIQVAVGPRIPDFGSWNWLGEGLIENLGLPFMVQSFVDLRHPPAADVVIFIKFLPDPQQLALISQNARVVFLPVDVYGNCREIDRSHGTFRSLSKVLVNSRRLVRYFQGYCDVDYVDHPLKYTLSDSRLTTNDGPLIWIGKLCNIRPVIEWFNNQSLGRELWVLTNIDEPKVAADSLGFFGGEIRVERWNEQRHFDFLSVASLAIDIKGNDFRARHKPPAKAFDYLASGIPVITNRGSSVDIHVSKLGISPLYIDNWHSHLTKDYRNEIFDASRGLRAHLNPSAVWKDFRHVLRRLAYLSE